MAVDVPVVIIVVPPLSFGRLSARGGEEGRAGREIVADENFFQPVPSALASLGVFASPWVANPRKGRLRSSFPIPQKLGADPTIANKIKGLSGFGGRVEGGTGVAWGCRAKGGGEKIFKNFHLTPLRGGHEIVYNCVVFGRSVDSRVRVGFPRTSLERA